MMKASVESVEFQTAEAGNSVDRACVLVSETNMIVVSLSWTEVRQTRDVGDRHTDVIDT